MSMNTSRIATIFALALGLLLAHSANAQDDTIGSTIGDQVDTMFQNLQRARAAKRNMNAAIASARTAWQTCGGKCPDARKLNSKFGQLLFEKDLYYLNFDIARRMTSSRGQGNAAAEMFGSKRDPRLDGIMRMTGGNVDGGLVKNCRPPFQDWSRCMYSRVVNKKTRALVRDKVRSALKVCESPIYSGYRKCRDAHETNLMTTAYARGRSGGDTQQCPKLGKLADAKLVWGNYAAQIFIGQNRNLYEQTYAANQTRFKSPKYKKLSLSMDLVPQYTNDPNLGFPSYKSKVLHCVYWDDCQIKRSATFFYWHKKQPSPSLKAGWAESLLPNSPFANFGPKRYACPPTKPTNVSTKCRGCFDLKTSAR